MEASRRAEALFRSSQPLLAAYRSSQSQRAATCIAQHCTRQRTQCLPSRAFTTHTSRRQQSQSPQQTPSPSSTSPSSKPSSRGSMPDGIIDDILNMSLDQTKGTPAAPTSRTSHFKSTNAQATNPPSRGIRNQLDSARENDASSVDDIMSRMGGGNFSNFRNNGGRNSEAYSVDLNPFGNPFGAGGKNMNAPPKPYEESAPMKLGPTVGRTVRVNEKQGVDVARAFRSVEMLCAKNHVRRDFMKQRFHERPGLKRKRLKSERWRKNFKENFRGIVNQVLRLKRQGW